MTEQQFSSNNFYEVLGVEPNASQNEIKRKYQALVLQYHPDKVCTSKMSCNIDERKDYFYLIDKAWKTLSDSGKRVEYDAMLRVPDDSCFQLASTLGKYWFQVSVSSTHSIAFSRDQQLNQDWAVDADVSLFDMDFNEERQHHTWPCRCSGLYEITDENLANGENIICCTTCSLTIRVLNYS